MALLLVSIFPGYLQLGRTGTWGRGGDYPRYPRETHRCGGCALSVGGEASLEHCARTRLAEVVEGWVGTPQGAC